MTTPPSRLSVLKTYKLYINGQFPRTESGRYFQVFAPRGKQPLANVCLGSRKDLRDAVQAARKAFAGWSGKTAYNRGQILYRVAEMLEQRRDEFISEITRSTGRSRELAAKEVDKSVDRAVWYAGWADKLPQIFGAVNPVAAPYFNFTIPEPTGVVGIVCPDEMPLLAPVSQLAPIIVAGNTCVLLASEKAPLATATLGEALATSDLPAGVVNILTGRRKELVPHMAKHMDINALDFFLRDDEAMIKMVQEEAAVNVKRVVICRHPRDEEWFDDAKTQSPYWIRSFLEMKTAWHPIGT
jgi:acyl-CoA reductase-like NAD-dependent aldehyde dehydrogenase